MPATPYAAGEVLPHERTHAGPKEGRLRLLRATHTQLEPIFLLYDAAPVFERPDGEPAADVEEGGVRTRIWPLEGGPVTIDTPLLIADGHHRYETAVAFRGGGAARDATRSRPGLVARAGARDLPDPPHRRRSRRGAGRARRRPRARA